MRHGPSGRRQRNRGHGGHGNNQGHRRGGSQNRMQVFDSNGPDVRIRGTAHQVVEKYLALAKDAASAGDRIVSESYLQHAEHYQRIINSFDESSDERFGGYTQAAQSSEQPAAPVVQRRDDLSLPASILGSPAKAESQEQTRAPETAS